jgi:hypothetical protein
VLVAGHGPSWTDLHVGIEQRRARYHTTITPQAPAVHIFLS